MKAKIKKKTFDTVKFFRQEKERIAREVENMDFKELKEYLAKNGKWTEKQ